jgi:tetratricopeptide (TPR) repeat protein
MAACPYARKHRTTVSAAVWDQSIMPASDEARRKRVESLAEKGFQLLRDGEYDAALAVAKQLRKARFTAAFEVAALAHAGKRDLPAAIAILEEGVRSAPSVWVNWQLLGNYRSDLKRYDDAAVAYEAALRCPNVDASYVHLNLAILAERRGRHSDALEWAGRVTDAHLALHAVPVRVRALSALGRYAQADRLANRVFAQKDVGEAYGSIAAALGGARLKRRDRRRDVRAFAVKALTRARGSSELLSLIRDIDNRYSRASKYWRILVHVRFFRPMRDLDGAIGYFTSYDVVAVNRKEAVRYIQSVDKVPRRAQISITEADILEPRPHDPKGVYRMTGRCFFENDD